MPEITGWSRLLSDLCRPVTDARSVHVWFTYVQPAHELPALVQSVQHCPAPPVYCALLPPEVNPQWLEFDLGVLVRQLSQPQPAGGVLESGFCHTSY